MLDENLIRRRFLKSSDTYDENAVIQRKMAIKLANHLIECTNSKYDNVFEIGCGTGILTNILINKLVFNRYYINDIVPEACNVLAEKLSGKKLELIPGNAENLNYPSNINLLTSNAAIQWFSNLELFFANINNYLADNAVIALTTFGKKNYKEISKITGNRLNYLSTEELSAILSKYFDILYVYEDVDNLYFRKVSDILRHMKLTGVTGIKKTYWTKDKLKNFEENYSIFLNSNGYSLTYNPIYIIARKR